MNPWINYHHLFYFRTIATEGSIARAAEKLRLGQPTLSAQLKQFEDALGMRLFDRQHKKLLLNEAGRIALQYANEIFKLGGEMIEVLNDRMSSARIHVQIGALDSVPKPLNLELVRAAYGFGECSVTLLEGKSDELIRELALHRIDLFISDFAPASGDGLHSRRVARVPVSFFAAPKFKTLRKGFPRSLDGQPLILPTAHSKLRGDLDHFLRAHQISANIAAETQDTSLQKLMGGEGLGLIPVAAFAVNEMLKTGELVEIGSVAGVYQEFYLVSASRRIENPISSRLMKHFELRR